MLQKSRRCLKKLQFLKWPLEAECIHPFSSTYQFLGPCKHWVDIQVPHRKALVRPAQTGVFLGGKKAQKKFSINKQSAVTRGRGGNFYICAWPCCIYISRSSFLKGQNIERGIFKSSMQSHLLTFASQNLLLIAPKKQHVLLVLDIGMNWLHLC